MRILKTTAILMIWTLLFGVAQAAEVDLKQSEFTWKGTKISGEHYGKISLQSAKVELEGEKIVKGELVMDMDSITVTDLKGEWADKFLAHVKNEDFFEIKKYPTSKLVIKDVKGDEYTGDLTIKGKTHPVTFKVASSGKTYSGVLTFNRTHFDMKYGSGSFFKGLGDNMIHDEVTVNFKVVLK